MHKELKKKSERAERASELNRRASDPGERATIFTRASERELGFLNFYASERARAGLPEFLRERASELLARARSRSLTLALAKILHSGQVLFDGENADLG